MRKIYTVIFVVSLLFVGVSYADEAAMKAELAAAENDIVTALKGPRTCSPNASLTMATDHQVTFAWSPGSKRKVTIVNNSYTVTNGSRSDYLATYEIEIIQGETSGLTAVEDTATGFIRITAPNVKIKKTQNGVTTEETTVGVKKPCKGGGTGWPQKITRLSNAAKTYWIWARDRG